MNKINLDIGYYYLITKYNQKGSNIANEIYVNIIGECFILLMNTKLLNKIK